MKLGIVSDAHGHVEAFQRAIGVLRREGAERLLFLGDAVGYLPGSSVIDVLMALEILPVAGNHETMLLSADVPAERDAIYRLRETRATMSGSQLDFIRSWPMRRELQFPGGDLLFVHGSLDNETEGYVYPDTDLSTIAVPAGTTVFMGHTHRPFVRRSGEAQFVNVGSCGLPRDCGHLGSACLFDSDSGTATILRFDISDVTAKALERCGPVHPSVQALFARRPSAPIVGTLVNV